MIELQTLAPGEKITVPGAYRDVPIATYHSGHLCDGPSISSSGLRTIFAESPAHYWVNSPLNPRRADQKEKDHFSLGRAAHHLLLGEADFAKHFVVRPEKWDSWRTNDAKTWREFQVGKGMTVLEPKHLELIEGMRDGLAENPLVRSGILNGHVEVTLATKDEETGIWLLARPDVIPADSGLFSDLKTAVSVDSDALWKSVSEYRYDMQGALVRRCAREAAGVEMEAFALVWAEKAPPFCTEVTELTLGEIEAAEDDNQVALRTFARCMETGRWPGPGGTQNDAVPVGLTDWARKRAERRRAFLQQELAAA